jgi:hypothetical protein
MDVDIHCKVLFGEEYRRFVIKSTDFKNLFETAKKLFNLPDGCVLKYKDDEGDLVTMSSDEELISALEFSSGLLKLFVVNPNQKPEMTIPGPHFRGRNCHQHHGHSGGPHSGPPQFPGHPHHQWEKKDFKNKKRGQKMEKNWEKKFEKKRGVRNPEVLRKRIFWLNKKREEFERRLQEMENLTVEGRLPPNLVQEQQVIERKLNGISCRLEKLSLLNSEIETSKGQSADPETLPDVPSQPKVEITEAEKQQFLAELAEIRQNLFKSCSVTTKDAKLKMKFAKTALDNFQGNPESEERKKLVQEFEAAQANFKENRKVLKSLLNREKELCDLLGITKRECKMMFKQEKKEWKDKKENHFHKKCKRHKQ